MKLEDRFEFTTPDDPYRNYCLWQYSPAAPSGDKFRGINLLYQSFDHAGLHPNAYAVVDAIRAEIGPFQTVFGVKWIDGALGWEYYFYDYARQEREVSAGRVLAALAPWARCDLRVDEQLPYFMFSLDIEEAWLAGRRPMDEVQVYIGNPGSSVSSGIAYALSAQGMTLKNFYFFFDAARDLDEAADKIACSAQIDASRIGRDEVLWPELRDCHTICVANKRVNDCVYFAGVDVDQLIFFLDALDYPPAIRDFVKQHRGDLDHLRYDVGFDYRMEEGRLRVLKSGYYGVF
jgi:hypothetical protein